MDVSREGSVARTKSGVNVEKASGRKQRRAIDTREGDERGPRGKCKWVIGKNNGGDLLEFVGKKLLIHSFSARGKNN